ncbi:MAG: nuclear transport factor 2 family protein [Cognatishimia sp.]
MSLENIEAISAQMEVYFDALYHADSARLRTVFHPKLAYVCATEGDELYLDLETYMARVDQRIPAAQNGEARADRVLEISQGGDRLAHVKAQMTLMGRDYLDYLTFVRHDGGWRLVAKVFSYIPMES